MSSSFQLVTSKKVVLLHLELWDAGDRAVKKYDHILPTCIEYTDGVMFFFSFIDRYVNIFITDPFLFCYLVKFPHSCSLSVILLCYVSLSVLFLLDLPIF